MWRRISKRQSSEGVRRRAVLEIVAAHGDTYRAIYTVRFHDSIYVLHAFQKKSKKGIATPQKEIDLIDTRLAAAERDYRERQN
jgi:phage-related protein